MKTSVLCLCCCLSGCTTAALTGTPDGDTAGDAAAADQAGLDGAAPGDDGTSPDGISPDAAAHDVRIDPIEVGRSWTYNVQMLGIYPTCSNGLHTATTVEKVARAGKTAFRVQSLCDNSGLYEYAVENDRVYSYYQGKWHLSLDEPVAEGHTWSDDFFDYEWKGKGTVTVAAGTFTDCWSASKKVKYDSYTIFCRGVGPIHWHYEDGLGNGYDALLTAKNF